MSDEPRQPYRIRDHIGVISGVFLVAIAFLFLVAIAAMGDQAALGLLIVVIVGLGLIALGTRMRG